MDPDLAILGAPEFYDELGARPRFAGSVARRARPRQRPGGGMPLRYVQPSVPGVAQRGARHQPLGMGSVIFNATSATALNMTVQPQRPFRGNRLVIQAARTGATATGLLTLTNFFIGSDNQLVGTGPLPAEAFAPNAFDVWLDLSPASTSINITITIAISALPGGTDTVAVSACIFGETIG